MRQLLGNKEHIRFQDVELALRFLALYKEGYYNYKSPMKHFLNSFMKKYRDATTEQIDEFSSAFNKAVYLVKSIIGQNAFYFFTREIGKFGRFEKNINKGLFDILMYGFSQYDKSQLNLHRDTIKEELFYRMVHDYGFREAITGTGTDNTKKLLSKMNIWEKVMKAIINAPVYESRDFSWEFKQKLWERNDKCSICGMKIDSLYDAEIANIDGYWRGNKTIPDNSRLMHRYCHSDLELKKLLADFDEPDREGMRANLEKVEKRIRECIHFMLLKKDRNYWEKFIPEGVSQRVDERIGQEVEKYPYKERELSFSENKLTFCDIRDYMKIIRRNWDELFENIFVSKTELEKHFNNLAEFRNAVNHVRELDSVTEKSGEAAIEWIQRVIQYSGI